MRSKLAQGKYSNDRNWSEIIRDPLAGFIAGNDDHFKFLGPGTMGVIPHLARRSLIEVHGGASRTVPRPIATCDH